MQILRLTESMNRQDLVPSFVANNSNNDNDDYDCDGNANSNVELRALPQGMVLQISDRMLLIQEANCDLKVES